jgi:HK97 family phage major capsid protein
VAGTPFDGVLYDPDVAHLVMGAGEVSFAQVTADHLLDLISIPSPASLYGTPKFYMHRTIFNVVSKLKSTTGDYIFRSPAGTSPGYIWEYPYELTDTLPSINDTAVDSPFIIFGDLRHLYLGDRKTLTLAKSQHVGFKQDLIYLRAIERISLKVGQPLGLSVLRTSAA